MRSTERLTAIVVVLALVAGALSFASGCAPEEPAAEAPSQARLDALVVLGLLDACKSASRPDAAHEQLAVAIRAASEANLTFAYNHVTGDGPLKDLDDAAKAAVSLYGDALDAWPDEETAFAQWSAAYDAWAAAGSADSMPDIDTYLAELTVPDDVIALWNEAGQAVDAYADHPGWDSIGGRAEPEEMANALASEFGTAIAASPPRDGALALLGTLDACASRVASEPVALGELSGHALEAARQLDMFIASRLADRVAASGIVHSAYLTQRLYWWSWEEWGDAGSEEPTAKVRYLWERAADRLEELRGHPDWAAVGGPPGEQ